MKEGSASLIITVILMIAVLMVMFYAANYSVIQQKTSSNLYRGSQAFEAAESGLEYGVGFLKLNNAAVLANPVSGYINYTISNASQADNSSYTITFKNPQANNFDLLAITSTGSSSDNSAIRIVEQRIFASAFLSVAIMTPANLATGGNTTIAGAVDVGQTVSLGNNSTITSITQNDTQLANLSNNDLFKNIFGTTKSVIKAQSAYYSTANSIVWNKLDGQVWVNSDVKITSNVTIGTLSNPVVIFANGNFTGTGSTTINGILYVMGNTKITGTLNLNGALVSEGDISVSGNIIYNKNIVSRFTVTSFSKIPGSWKDF